ncbi:hypothetical protein [Azotobacter salinestris]
MSDAIKRVAIEVWRAITFIGVCFLGGYWFAAGALTALRWW